MTKPSRVIIDADFRGIVAIFGDPGIEVFWRSAHTPDDEIYRFAPRPIPEEWLAGKPIGHRFDGSDAEKRAELIAEAISAGARS